jgi:hypothetical protein
MRSVLTASLVLVLTQSAGAFSITPVPGADAGVSLPQFVAAGAGAASGSNPFYGSGAVPRFGDITLAPEAYRGTFQLRSGPFLFGSDSFTTRPGWAVTGTGPSPAARFGLTPSLSGTSWDIGRAQLGYLAGDNLLFYTGVTRAQPTATSPNLPIPPGIGLRDEQRGLTAARAGVQWQAMPGLTLGVEVSGVTGAR